MTHIFHEYLKMMKIIILTLFTFTVMPSVAFETPNTQLTLPCDSKAHSTKGLWLGQWWPSENETASSCLCQIANQIISLKTEGLTLNNASMKCTQVCNPQLLSMGNGHCTYEASQQKTKYRYPSSPKGPINELIHGERISDPYRWLEDPNSNQTKQWVKKQSTYTRDYLDQLPNRSKLREEIEAVWNYPKMSTPKRKQIEGDQDHTLFYFFNDGLQNQSVLYMSPEKQGIAGAEVLLDPNTLSQDGVVALKTTKLSPNGRYLAYQFAQAGSDWVEIKIRDVRTKKDLVDHLKWVKFSGISWLGTSGILVVLKPLLAK